MANRHRRSLCCELEFAFDRLHAAKLEQVFAILVPNRERRIDESTGLKGESHENSRHLRPCLFGSTERGEGKALHVRKATSAEPEQMAIYRALKVNFAPGGISKTIA